MTAAQVERFREWLRQEREHEEQELRGRNLISRGDERVADYLDGRSSAFRSALIALGCAEVGALYLRSENEAALQRALDDDDGS